MRERWLYDDNLSIMHQVNRTIVRFFVGDHQLITTDYQNMFAELI